MLSKISSCITFICNPILLPNCVRFSTSSTKGIVALEDVYKRQALGECFGIPIGTNVKGKMVSALRRLGFDDVFDTDVSADLTIVEEATELVDRIKNNGTLPMITSCSPCLLYTSRCV